MVKNKRRRAIRLTLAVTVVLVCAGATVALLVTSGPASPTGGGAHTAPPPAPSPPAQTSSSPTQSTPAQPVPTPKPTPHRPAPAPVGSLAGPLGLRGRWTLVFDDEFNGDALNTSVWNTHDGWTNQNGVTDSAANVTVSGGHAILTLASPSSGAEIGTQSFGLAVGQFAQARIEFPGRGATVDNWPAFWTSGPDWPAGGENDVAEGFGALTVNYHSPTVVHLTGRVRGDWAGRFHVFGIYRGRTFSRVYWDGRLVRTYGTADNGEPETILLTLGAGDHVVTGPAGALIVDYVRVWAPA